MPNCVGARNKEHWRRVYQVAPVSKEQVDGCDRRKYDVQLKCAEPQKEHRPQSRVVSFEPGVDKSEQQVELEQEKECAKNLVVCRRPYHWLVQNRTNQPKNRRQETSDIRSGEPPGNSRNQYEIEELSAEDESAVRQRFHAEQLPEREEEQAFAQRTHGTLRHGAK